MKNRFVRRLLVVTMAVSLSTAGYTTSVSAAQETEAVQTQEPEAGSKAPNIDEAQAGRQERTLCT